MCKYFYFLVFSAIFFTSCAGEGQTEKKFSAKNEVVIKDKYKTVNDGEIVIDGTDLEDKTAPIATSQKSLKELPRTAFDGSQISTMYDGFGNKTEIRTFSNNLLVQSVIAKSFADGQKRIFVYGQNGEVKNLTEDYYEKALTAPGDFLANSAGIFTGRINIVLQTSEEKSDSPTLLPVPAFPVNKPQIADEPEIITEKQPKKNNILADLQKLELKPKKKQL